MEKIVSSFPEILDYELDSGPSTDKLLGQYVARIFIQAARLLAKRGSQPPKAE